MNYLISFEEYKNGISEGAIIVPASTIKTKYAKELKDCYDGLRNFDIPEDDPRSEKDYHDLLDDHGEFGDYIDNMINNIHHKHISYDAFVNSITSWFSRKPDFDILNSLKIVHDLPTHSFN